MAQARPLAVLDRRDRQVLPAGDAIAARPDAGEAGAPLGVDDDAPARERQHLRAAEGGGHEHLPDGVEHHVGGERVGSPVPASRPSLGACART